MALHNVRSAVRIWRKQGLFARWTSPQSRFIIPPAKRRDRLTTDDASPSIRQAENQGPPDTVIRHGFGTSEARQVSFDRSELNTILNLYGTKVASGEWRDYAMDFSRDAATFCVFRRTSEVPLYRIIKDPKLARKQGLYSVVAQGGLILKRGHDLAQVLRVLVKSRALRLV
jgi:Protein of unknown function (DUF2794)